MYRIAALAEKLVGYVFVLLSLCILSFILTCSCHIERNLRGVCEVMMMWLSVDVCVCMHTCVCV